MGNPLDSCLVLSLMVAITSFRDNELEASSVTLLPPAVQDPRPLPPPQPGGPLEPRAGARPSGSCRATAAGLPDLPARPAPMAAAGCRAQESVVGWPIKPQAAGEMSLAPGVGDHCWLGEAVGGIDKPGGW